MLASVQQYNALNGVIIREDLQQLATNLQNDEQLHLASKLTSLLANNETVKKFDIDVTNKGFETLPASLLGCLECITDPEEEFTGLNKAVSADNIYQMVTDKIIKNLETAEKWEKPFNAESVEGYRLAINFITKKPYRSVNQLILGSDLEYMYGDGSLLENPYYLTFKQIEKLGGKVKKGTTADQAIYYTVLYTYKNIDKNIDYGTYDIKKMNTYLKNKGFSKQDVFYNELPILKYYNVFNGKDITGIDFELATTKIVGYVKKGVSKKNTLIDSADAIIKNFPTPAPKVVIKGKQPLYNRKADTVEMPNIKHFDYSEAYYTVLFHEHIHATGSKNRLDRKKGAKFGDKDYAFEELIAEVGASFLSSNAGILHHTLRNGAAYIKSWHNVLLKILKEDNRFIFRASTQAQKAADFILQPDENGVPKYLKGLEKKAAKKEVEPVETPVKPTLSMGKNSKAIINKLTPSQLYFSVDNQEYAINRAGVFFKVAANSNAFIKLNSSRHIYITGDINTDDKIASIIAKKLKVKVVKDQYIWNTTKKKVNSYFLFPYEINVFDVDAQKDKEKEVENEKEKELAKERAKNYYFSKTDIPYKTAYNAHSGTSFSPEKRAEQEQNGYFEYLADLYDLYRVKALKADRLEEFENNFNRFQAGYLKRKLAVLQSRNGLVSTMIAGGSNFPVRRMNKKNNVIDNRLRDLYGYMDKAATYILPNRSSAIKTGVDSALDKLKAKLEKLEANQELWKTINKLIRRYSNKKHTKETRIAGIKKEAAELGFKESTVDLLIKGDKIPSYMLTNNNANIKTVKSRIVVEERLAKLKEVGNKEVSFPDGKVIDNIDVNRIQIEFNDKPSAEIRTFLKQRGHAFKWSPKNSVWQRQLNTYHKYSRTELYKFLGVETSPTPEPPEPVKKSVEPKPVVPPVKVDTNGQTALFGAAKQPSLNFEVVETPIVHEPVISTVSSIPVSKVLETPVEVKKVVTKSKSNAIISTDELMSMEFETLPFTGEWANFLENPPKNMQLAIWGKPKNGKTSSACQFANYLTNFGNVLYNFADQGVNASTQKIWKLAGLDKNDKASLSSARTLDELEDICKTGEFDFVFIDMINTYIDRTGIKHHEFQDRFMKAYPNISFILVFEVTKSGNFKGDQAWTHLPDVLVTVEDYVMNATGRYGMGHYVGWKEGLQKANPKKYNELYPNGHEPTQTNNNQQQPTQLNFEVVG